MVYALTMDNMSAKFDEEAHVGLVYIVFTSLFPYMWNVSAGHPSKRCPRSTLLKAGLLW